MVLKMATLDELKKAAGIKAANEIQDGMTVGLGTGSTAAYMVEHLAKRIKEENGFSIGGYRLVFSGLCSDCVFKKF